MWQIVKSVMGKKTVIFILVGGVMGAAMSFVYILMGST
jgi:hypothetical protein